MNEPTITLTSKTKPLSYIGNKLLVSKGFNLFVAGLDLSALEFIQQIPTNLFLKFAIKFRLLSRLLRLELGPAIALQSLPVVLVCRARVIYAVNLETKEVKKDFEIPRGSRPLMLAEVGLNGFKPGIYFGEYLSNPNKQATHIYRRDIRGVWEIAYTFADGEINHVHAIIPDTKHQCLYLLTGDFGQAATIWRADKDFSQVRRIGTSGQASRACWVHPVDKRLFYSTDTQLEVNYFTSIDVTSTSTPLPQQHFPVLGSSIYYSQRKDNTVIFSTSVEPDKARGNKFVELFTRRAGPGIISDRAAIYRYENGSGRLLMTAKKDQLPLRLFQFGTFQFPFGVCPDDNILHAYGVGLKGYDNKTITIRLLNM